MQIQPLEILKWVGIALAAGFVGYFGRYLAMLIIEKMHRKGPVPGNKAATQQAEMGKARLKAEKKKAKAEAKKAKKEG